MADGLNLTINTDSVSDDALQLDNILGEIDTCLTELNNVIERVIPAQVDTDWSNELQENWKTYYNGSIQNSMENLKDSGEALRAAVEVALAYNK